MAVSFDVRGVSTKRKTGSAYRVMADDEQIAFECLTTDAKNKAPDAEQLGALSFALGWNEIAEIRKPSTMLDTVLRIVTTDGQKVDCLFSNDGDEVKAYRELKKSFSGKTKVVFTHERTPAWKLMVLPLGFTIVMVVLGYLGFCWFDHLEQEGGRIRTHALIILIYETLGKYGVFGAFLLLALTGLYWGGKRLRTYKAIEASGDVG